MSLEQDISYRGTASPVAISTSRQSGLAFIPDDAERGAGVSVSRDRRTHCLDRYQLVSAGIGMIRQPDGQYVLLELNGHHEWLWLQRITGLPVSSATADLLESGGVAA